MAGTTWHDRPAVALENDLVRLVAVPSLGARVVSLVDRRTGREWLVGGEPPGIADAERWSSEDAVFGGAEAFGWDECLPTVAPCPDPLDPAGTPLRDHGDQWGRATSVEAGLDGFSAAWASPRWPLVLRRTLRLDGPAVVAEYRLDANGDRALPVLWSMHALLALEPGAWIVVEPAARARLTHHTGLGIAPDLAEVDWPVAPTATGGSVALDVVRAVEAGQAAKLYLAAAGLSTVAARGVDGAELRFAWDRAVAPALGIWFSYGGWPPGEPGRRHQVAIEPTTSPDDDLAGALATGRARVVEPGTPLRWTVRMELVAGS
jgi:hypothetical protein